METDSPYYIEADVRDRKKYRKILVFMAVWVIAVALAIGRVETPPAASPPWMRPDYTAWWGYTKSLALVYLPWVFLLIWYKANKDALQLSAIGKALTQNALVVAGIWVALDVFLANLIFQFPDARAHIKALEIPGYSWADNCQTLRTIFDLSCYKRSIPFEEVLFYLGSAALLRMLYMWGAEDMFKAYSLPREVYKRDALDAVPLIDWNKRLLVTPVVLLAIGIALKKLGPHPFHDGLPYYLFAQLVIVFLPLSALYNRVHQFTNPRAFLFVMVLQVLISVVWEATLAAPYGWWDYRMTAMVGLVAVPWSRLALEACFLWVSVAWGVMFMYEASKIKALTGLSWRDVLWGQAVAAKPQET
jgi:hypothetical protein